MEQLTSNPRPKSVSTHTVNARRNLSYDKSTKYRAFCFYTTFPDLYDIICELYCHKVHYIYCSPQIYHLSHIFLCMCHCVSTIMRSLYKLSWLMPGTNCSENEIPDTFFFSRVLIKENCSTLEGNGPFKVFTLKTPIQRLSSHIKYYTDVGLWG